MGQFIDKGMDNPGERIAAWSAQGTGGDASWNEGCFYSEVGDEVGGEFAGTDVRGGDEFFAFTETDEMVMPGSEFAVCINATAHVLKTTGTIEVVTHIVFARVEQFDGCAREELGNPGGFDHVVIGETTAEATAGAELVDRDVCRIDAKGLSRHLLTATGSLTGGPDFELAVFEFGGAIARFELGVRDEGEGVFDVDSFCSSCECGFDVAFFADGESGFLGEEFGGFGGVASAAVGSVGAFFPDEIGRASCRERVCLAV